MCLLSRNVGERDWNELEWNFKLFPALWTLMYAVSDWPLDHFFFCKSFLLFCTFSLEPSALWTFTVLLNRPDFCVFQSELWTQFCTCQLFDGPLRKKTSSCDLDAVIMPSSDHRSLINTSSWMLVCRTLTQCELCICRLAHVSAELRPDLFSHWKDILTYDAFFCL